MDQSGKKYRVLILMSTYNGEKYLSVQLDSILKQTIIDDIFIYVRDDGSKDKTIQILEEYKKTGKLDYYQGKNLGSAKSFHDLLRHAPRADFYAFADQDDYWLPEKVEDAVKALKDPAIPAMYGTKKIVVDVDLKPLNRPDTTPQLDGPYNVFLHRNEISGCTMCMTDALRDIYMKCHDIPEGAYHDSWIVKLASVLGTIIFSEKAEILYRQHGNNVVGIQNEGKALFWQRIKNFDFTLKKYRERRFQSTVAGIFYNTYKDELSPENKELLFSIAHIHESWKCRLKLFLKPGFAKKPLYEFVVYKMYMLLGLY